MDMNLSKLQEIVKNREVWCAQSMRSQRVRLDLATKQQQQKLERHIKLLGELEAMITFHLSILVESLLFKERVHSCISFVNEYFLKSFLKKLSTGEKRDV